MAFKLDEEFADLLVDVFSALAEEGIQVVINSAWRSPQRQAALFRQFGPGRVAKPGGSFHEFGFAVDISISPDTKNAWIRVGQVVEAFGLRWGGRFKVREPWHIDAGTFLPIGEARKLYGRGESLVEVI